MASTGLSNVSYASSVFADTMSGVFTHKLEALNSGLLAEIPDEIVSPNQTGDFAGLPKWDTLSGSSTQITSSSTLTFQALADIGDVGVWVNRENGWSADQIVRMVAGKDPTIAVAEQLGQYLASECHRYALIVQAAVFGTALLATHTTGATYSGAPITKEGFVKAKRLLGDNANDLTISLLNSYVYQDAVLDGLTVDIATYSSELMKSGKITQLLGTTPYATDKLAAVSSVYPTLIGAPSSMIYKFRNYSTLRNTFSQQNQTVFNVGMGATVETHRNALANGGQDGIILRYSLLAHVPGVKWSSATTNPTDGQLGTGSNWTKVATDNKTIRLVQLNTMASS